LLVAEDAALASESVTPLAVIEAAAAVYELATTLSSDADTSVPLGDQLKAKVGDMSLQVANHISDTANGLDSLQQVIVSDYGRLQALGSVAGTPGWTDTKNAMAGNLRSAGRKLFYSGLMPVPYGVYLLRKNTTGGVEPTADNCFDLKYVPGRERPTPRS